jgi:rhodanese-related sulfurtransferase
MSIKVVILVVLGVALLFALARRGGDVDGQQARGLVQAGAQLLDVRTPGEFASGHIEGAINIPVQDLGGRLAELGDKKRGLVVYCRSGHRSGQASKLLKGAGFSAVHDLGAMTRW